jgi:hypothetical protein
MLLVTVGTGIAAGGDGGETKPVPEVDLYGTPPICC